ncbi:hypothetical protein CbuD7D7780_02350 [Coxiella burnetii]|uniref:Hypothetical membrane spanning protein n=1 Tax=Coxiella burnetii (strain Dugway 5J108-111) TaxID=434922 RepID=A9KF73_COXBN|nr:Dot/Icm type IV secretion system anti-apoptotic effector CaeB [Coxiella burnetii]ABS77063.1 hypothetical membrane spanning protein [Coxiella burnetii Dugway 5J108-111]OYK80786.1 hypothetical protein CbuD7E6568_02330 [Coxiella burnetii]OYK82874.1 hypothetical protein CbuD7D7780_02350 [Coxiella burnetii]
MRDENDPSSTALFPRLNETPSHLELAEDDWDSWMKNYFVFGALLTPIGYLFPLPLTNLLSGAGWNYVDSAGGVATGLSDYSKAKESLLHHQSKSGLAYLNLFWSAGVLPSVTTWGLITTIKSIKTAGVKSLMTTGATAGSAAALAASAFAFGGAMFICALNSAMGWYRAWQKTNPFNLLKDRVARYNELEKKLQAIEKRLSILKLSQNDKIQREVEELRNQQTKLEKKKEIAGKQITALYKYLRADPEKPNKKVSEIELPFIVDKQPTNAGELKLVDYLIKKQEQKRRAKKLDTAAWALAGIAATCAGLALLFPIAFPVLAAAAVFCYGAAAVIKFYQLHKKSKARRCQQAILEKLKDDRQDPKNYLIWQHFCRNLSPKEQTSSNYQEFRRGLSTKDCARIVALECKIYEKKEKHSQNRFAFFQSRTMESAALGLAYIPEFNK